MAINRVLFGDKIVLDLSNDGVNEHNLLNGITAHDKTGKLITGECPYDCDTSDTDIKSDEILQGSKAFARGGEIIGTMPNKENWSATIKKATDSIAIPTGFHEGGGRVEIDEDERKKILEENIREGVEILGVKGSMSGKESVKTEPGEATPTVAGFTLVPTAGYYFTEVAIKPIPYEEIPNDYGTTVKIG